MKYGLQTIAWDDEPLETVLQEAKQAGYEGVEIAQSIPRDDFKNAWNELKKSQLTLAGLSGGDLRSRLEFVRFIQAREPNYPLPYVYSDDWTENEDDLYRELDVPCPIAIHPHMFKPIQTEADAMKVISSYPYTTLMPDTGHLAVAGEDVVGVIQRHLSQLRSLHLKDWSPEFGRSLPFFSRGFCALGRGGVPISRVLRLLCNARYNGWVIVEQDYCPKPTAAARESLQFIKAQS